MKFAFGLAWKNVKKRPGRSVALVLLVAFLSLTVFGGAVVVTSLKNGLDGYCVHDACPVFYSVYPDMFRAEEAGVYVETRGRITEGKTVVDRDTDVKFGEKNAVVVLDLDRAWFAREITGILSEI